MAYRTLLEYFVSREPTAPVLSDNDIRTLLARRSESPSLDYKEGFSWTKANQDKKYELLRDLMAMANTKDGGRVIFGVRNSDFEFIGTADDVYDSSIQTTSSRWPMSTAPQNSIAR